MTYSRTRQTGSSDLAQYTIWDVGGPLDGGGGVVYPPVVVPTSALRRSDVSICNDTVTENYKKLQSDGVIVMNPVSIQKTNRQTQSPDLVHGQHPYWGTRTFKGEMAAAWAQAPVMPPWYATRITDAKYQTITEAHAKVASLDFMSMVTVAEAHKTAKTIAGPFSGALKALAEIEKRRDALRPVYRHLAQAAAKAWNEYRFGWKPLLYDIEGIIESYQHNTAVGKPTRYTVRASKFIDYQVTETYSPVVNGLTHVDMLRDVNRQAKVSSGVLYTLQDDGQLDERRRSMGLRLSDVPASLWELVPWSFIADRFLTIGSWLQAIVPKPGVTINGSWTTTVDTREETYEILRTYVDIGQIGSYPPVRLEASGGRYLINDSSYVREVNPSLPIAPSFNVNALGVQQQIDHAALIYQKIFDLMAGVPRVKNPF